MRTGIKETVKRVTYENGARVTTVEQVISRSDDCAKLGDLYYRMSDYYHRLDGEISDEERAAIEKDLVDVKAQIEVYSGYLDGYSE